MCGRFACTLDNCHLQRACSYKLDRGHYILPSVKYFSGNSEYNPGYNIVPSSTTPILVSSSHLHGEENESGRLICQMQWGMSLPWNRATTVSNCRSESIMEKPIFSLPFSQGQRAIAVADGFYEWQTVPGTKNKQPYFIHIPSEVKWEDFENADLTKFWGPRKGWTGPKLLNMAVIFKYDEHFSPLGVGYSYSIITTESEGPFSAIHNRVPIILDTEDKIETWLTTDSQEEALALLQPPSNLEWHMVSKFVNNSKNQGSECLKKIDHVEIDLSPKKKKKLEPQAGQKPITSFFKKSPAKGLGLGPSTSK